MSCVCRGRFCKKLPIHFFERGSVFRSGVQKFASQGVTSSTNMDQAPTSGLEELQTELWSVAAESVQGSFQGFSVVAKHQLRLQLFLVREDVLQRGVHRLKVCCWSPSSKSDTTGNQSVPDDNWPGRACYPHGKSLASNALES